jgi:putative transposase
MSVAEASRQLGVSEQASYRWKKVHGSLQSDQLRELQLLQEENARLKKLVAELSLDKAILQDINSKRWPGPR